MLRRQRIRNRAILKKGPGANTPSDQYVNVPTEGFPSKQMASICGGNNHTHLFGKEGAQAARLRHEDIQVNFDEWGVGGLYSGEQFQFLTSANANF